MDLTVASSKIGAAASVTAATYTLGYTPSDWALVGIISFAIVQTFTVTVKNWGESGGWSAWFGARLVNAQRVWAWIRRCG